MEKPNFQKPLKDYDEAWEKIIEIFFKEFMEFFFPKYALNIDFNKKIKFLDKEVKKLFPNSKKGKGVVDLLIECYTKNGSKLPIYLHIDVQGYYEKDFSKRMFKYFYRIFDRFNVEPITLVIFSDKNKNFHPNKYEWKWQDNKLIYEYAYAKLLDYKNKIRRANKK